MSSETNAASSIAADGSGLGSEPANHRTGERQPVPTEFPVAFVDSSALVALADAGDASHQAAVAAYEDLVGGGYRLFTTDYMTVETFELLSAGPGAEVAQRWLRECKLAVCHVEERDVAQAQRLVLDRGLDNPISLANAISLVVMERLGVTDVFAVDQTVLHAIS